MKVTRKNTLFPLSLMMFMICGCSNTSASASTSNNNPTTSIEPVMKEANVIILCGQSNAEGNTWNRMLMEKKPSFI